MGIRQLMGALVVVACHLQGGCLAGEKARMHLVLSVRQLIGEPVAVACHLQQTKRQIVQVSLLLSLWCSSVGPQNGCF